jgi:TonB family protein
MNALGSNLILYSLQIACVAGIAAAAASALPVRLARARLAYWRLVVVTAIALPIVSRMPTQDSLHLGPAIADYVGGPLAASGGAPVGTLASLLPFVLIAGALAKCAWLAIGMVRLRRLRRLGSVEALESDLATAVAAIAPRAEFRWSDDVAEPVTFGHWRPVVLLPRCLLDWPAEIRRAVLIHETWHVARRDWLWLVLEHLVQSVFWFHPAMWWAVDQIQLAREQVVDALVVEATGSRRAYLRAMVAFADVVPAATVAAPFIGRRHLLQRVEAIAAASAPSVSRSIGAVVMLIVVTGTTAIGASRWLPLHRLSQDAVYEPGNGVTLPAVVKEVRPTYTDEAKAARIQGTVLLSCVVATDGQPARIAVVASLDAVHGLDAAAVAALQQWRFTPGLKEGKAVAVRVQIEMTFTLK